MVFSSDAILISVNKVAPAQDIISFIIFHCNFFISVGRKNTLLTMDNVINLMHPKIDILQT